MSPHNLAILGLYRENGKENGNGYNDYSEKGLCRNNGKENGTTKRIILYRGYVGIM